MKTKKPLWQRLFKKFRNRKDWVAIRRNELSDELDRLFQSKVAYGPFKGLRFPETATWSRHDRAPMLLGIYEAEVLDIIQKLQPDFKNFINIGAADGYYSVGALVSKKFTRSVAFEIDEKSRDIIKEVACLNGVGDSIRIEGAATSTTMGEIAGLLGPQTFMLIDVEGFEYELLNAEALRLLRETTIVVEMHVFTEFQQLSYANFIAKCADTHKVSIVKTTHRDLSRFNELYKYSDNDRWLICSEGRPLLMEWVHLEPL